MRALCTLIVASSLIAPVTATAAEDPLRAAITAAIEERVGTVRSVEIEIVSGAASARPSNAAVFSATPAPGARFGNPVRFVVTPSSGPSFQVVARVTAVAAHAVAIRPIERGTVLTAADVEWKEGVLDGQLLQPLPSIDDVLGAQARRSIAQGEVLIGTALARPAAVRAGEEVTLTIRSGALEVRGAARAVSSGSVGDVIRVTTPGSREIRRARVTAPATVEMVR